MLPARVRVRPTTTATDRAREKSRLIFLSVVAAGVAIVATGLANEVTRSQHSELNTRLTLAQAKDALIARAVAHSTHPGALPCPDTDNDGEETPPGSRRLPKLHRTAAVADAGDR